MDHTPSAILHSFYDSSEQISNNDVDLKQETQERGQEMACVRHEEFPLVSISSNQKRIAEDRSSLSQESDFEEIVLISERNEPGEPERKKTFLEYFLSCLIFLFISDQDYISPGPNYFPPSYQELIEIDHPSNNEEREVNDQPEDPPNEAKENELTETICPDSPHFQLILSSFSLVTFIIFSALFIFFLNKKEN